MVTTEANRSNTIWVAVLPVKCHLCDNNADYVIQEVPLCKQCANDESIEEIA